MTPTQLELPTVPSQAPSVRSSDTSKDAARAMEPHLGRLEARVLYWIKAAYTRGATCDEVEGFSGLLHTTTSARIRRLAQIGRIVDSGERRKTRSGRNAVVWKVVP